MQVIGTLFADRPTQWRLIWTAPNGELVGAWFNSWDELESFSQGCVKHGLCPYVPADCPTPYDKG